MSNLKETFKASAKLVKRSLLKGASHKELKSSQVSTISHPEVEYPVSMGSPVQSFSDVQLVEFSTDPYVLFVFAISSNIIDSNEFPSISIHDGSLEHSNSATVLLSYNMPHKGGIPRVESDFELPCELICI